VISGTLPMPVEIDLANCGPFMYQQKGNSKSNNFILLKFILYTFLAFPSFIRHSHRQRSTHFLHFGLILFLAFSALMSLTSASTLILSAPVEVDVCAPEVYNLNFVSSADANELSALVQIPEGFLYQGNAKILFGGRELSCQPRLSEGFLEWDLCTGLKSCRNVVINEWEQNPQGTDLGNEWIELYNPTLETVNIGGWKLIDGYSGKSISIPAGTVIPSEGYQILKWTNGSLINTQPTNIILFNSAGQEVDRTLAAKDEKNNNKCWARHPNGKDLGSDEDWIFQESTPGSSNGGSSSDIYADETLQLEFNLTAGCRTSPEVSISSEVQSDVGTISAPSRLINVRRADLSFSTTPNRFDVAKGDEITWTILLENDGEGTAYHVMVNASLDSNLQPLELPSLSPTWTFASLRPGATEEIKLKTRVVSSHDHYTSIFNAIWGCGPCQKIGQISELDARTAILKLPDNSRGLAIGEIASYEISADLPSGAQNLWINDTISRGLTYNQSSLSVQGLIPQKEIMTTNGDGSVKIDWLFGDAGPADAIEISYNCILTNSPNNQDGVIIAGTKATMSWEDEQGRKFDADEAGTLTVVEPDLAIEMQASTSHAAANDSISFQLCLYHTPQSNAPAHDVNLEDILPSDLIYFPGSAEVLVGPASNFDAQNLKWHFDTISPDWDSSRKILIRVNATSRAPPGMNMINKAKITWTSFAGANPDERTGEGGINDYLRNASAQVNAMELSIGKTADPNPARVGEPLSYTLTYENLGGGVAHNVAIIDELDPRISFLSANPAPANSDNNTWSIRQLLPDGPHSITIKALVSGTLDNGVLLMNRFSIKCDELGTKSGTIFTEVQNGTLLRVNKTALQKAVRRGEEVSYIIRVCNGGGQPATNVTVRDVFDSSVEFVSAWPEMTESGIWKFASLGPGECVEISLTVRVPRIDVKYISHQTIRGNGFVRTYRDYTTSREPSVLTNRVYVVSDQMQLTAYAKVAVLAEDGTDLSIREHGSGEYETRENLRFLTANKSIKLDRSLRANYYPIAILLPRNSSQNISSLWSIESRAHNGITNTSLQESYRYSTELDSQSLFDLDENESKLEIESDFQGSACIETTKRPFNSTDGTGDVTFAEKYLGSFQLSNSIRDLGQELTEVRSVDGKGYVAKDMHIGDRRRSFESGTGSYRCLERLDAFGGFMAKDLDAEYSGQSFLVTPQTSLDIDQKWKEGMWSRSPSSFIGEKYFNANRLKKKTVAKSPKELESEATFSGIAELRVAHSRNYGKNGSTEVDQDSYLMGDYVVKRKIILSGIFKYDQPHINLSKDGKLLDDVATYTITITNDGNSTLGPVFLQDAFPPGARFLNSSLWPSNLDQNHSNWTLTHLSIGDSIKIKIDLDVKKCDGNIINRAEVAGNSSFGQAIARNLSIIDRSWLGGCSPAEKELQPGGISCACSEETYNETENFDPVLSRWDDNEEGTCPLNCPSIEDAHATVNPESLYRE
jgi:uncharacterized repeat protein (TIGR01451 family)